MAGWTGDAQLRAGLGTRGGESQRGLWPPRVDGLVGTPIPGAGAPRRTGVQQGRCRTPEQERG